MSLKYLTLEVPRKSLEKVQRWYEDVIGMTVMEQTASTVNLGFENKGDSAWVQLLASEKKIEGRNDEKSYEEVYWKIGIGLADVSAARDRLMRRGVAVTEAQQFRDIGFLCHLKDPAGYSIEILQHQFEANFSKPHTEKYISPDIPLGQTAVVGQITLRIVNAATSLAFYTEILGMKLLSRQKVEDYGFELYFLAAVSEEEAAKMPDPKDLDSVENREWLWQREYTTLELQHRLKRTKLLSQTPLDEPGFRGFAVGVSKERFEKLRPRAIKESKDEVWGDRLHLKDPDGTDVTVVNEKVE